MRAVVQRVSSASVTVEGRVIGAIGVGVLVLLAVGHGDGEETAVQLARKILGLRIFPDADGKMNLDLAQAGGEVLAVSQFTLYGDCTKGRRPSFVNAGPPELADQLVQRFVEAVRAQGVVCQTGQFAATMEVALVNHGPVTLLLDSDRTF